MSCSACKGFGNSSEGCPWCCGLRENVRRRPLGGRRRDRMNRESDAIALDRPANTAAGDRCHWPRTSMKPRWRYAREEQESEGSSAYSAVSAVASSAWL